MNVTATIDYELSDDESNEMAISNWGDQVRLQAEGLFEGSIYIDRDELLAAIAALNVAAGSE